MGSHKEHSTFLCHAANMGAAGGLSKHKEMQAQGTQTAVKHTHQADPQCRECCRHHEGIDAQVEAPSHRLQGST